MGPKFGVGKARRGHNVVRTQASIIKYHRVVGEQLLPEKRATFVSYFAQIT